MVAHAHQLHPPCIPAVCCLCFCYCFLGSVFSSSLLTHSDSLLLHVIPCSTISLYHEACKPHSGCTFVKPFAYNWDLHCIPALQTITLPNPSSASEPYKILHQAEGFRLFATQNPNTGYFKGRREALSAALLNRFVHVVFRQLPGVEWEAVVASQLEAGGLEAGEATKLAVALVEFHTAVQEKTCSPSFCEVCARFAIVCQTGVIAFVEGQGGSRRNRKREWLLRGITAENWGDYSSPGRSWLVSSGMQPVHNASVSATPA